MSFLPNDDCFILVIKTDSYAGNFEREMCGFMTGQIGDCGVGDDCVELFQSENPENYEFEDLVISFPDDHGCYRPCTIWWPGNTSVAIFFESKPTEEQFMFLRNRARDFAAKTDPCDGEHATITIQGFELREYSVKHTDVCISIRNGSE